MLRLACAPLDSQTGRSPRRRYAVIDAKQIKTFQIGGGVLIICAVVLLFAAGWLAAMPMAIGGVALIIISSMTTPTDQTETSSS